MIANGVIGIIIAYLLGSIPSAYIITRLAKGKDIRQVGGGNVGTRNVFREVGLGAAIAVGIFDVGKGAAAVAIAYWLLDASQLFVLAAGLAAVVGHMWSIYLKFTGGNGLATTLGVLSVLMTRELVIALAVTTVLIVFTRNTILSVNISLLSVPISGWFLKETNWLFVVFPILLILIMILHFIPTAKAALAKAGSRENLFAELLRSNKAKKA